VSAHDILILDIEIICRLYDIIGNVHSVGRGMQQDIVFWVNTSGKQGEILSGKIAPKLSYKLH